MKSIRRQCGRRRGLVALACAAVAASGCQDRSPTGVTDSFPTTPITVELELPWSVFASNLEVFGGYGVPAELPTTVVANDFGGVLDARTLVRFDRFPDRATVRDSTGTARVDSALVVTGGTLVAYFDTIASTNTGPVTLGLGAIGEAWDVTTATWTHAVDTINDLRPWTEPGAGPVADYGTAEWDPATGDTVLFVLDSAQVAAWADTTDLGRGARLELITAGERLRMNGWVLRLDAQSSIADTVVTLIAPPREVTFVYDPFPTPPPDGVRIGGAPSWRTILDVSIPEALDGIPALCDTVACPHTLQSGEVSYAALVLTSRASDAAFQPTDSIALDARPVLQRSAMPKSPLGDSFVGSFFGKRVAPEAFGSAPGQAIEIPITLFVRDLLDGAGEDGIEPPNTLALLSAIEPLSITYASFFGPGGPDEPVLRLVLTIGALVELP